MESSVVGRLSGWEIHGFRTMEDLDIRNIMEEAKTRWLRPNEIHAILYNHKIFSVNVKPVNLPQRTFGKMAITGRRRRMGRRLKKLMNT